MSTWEKLEWVVIFVALLSVWPWMLWPTPFWRAVAWGMIGVLAGIFVWRMILFHRRLREMDPEAEERQGWPPTGPQPSPPSRAGGQSEGRGEPPPPAPPPQ
jgi:hypothetical protein